MEAAIGANRAARAHPTEERHLLDERHAQSELRAHHRRSNTRGTAADDGEVDLARDVEFLGGNTQTARHEGLRRRPPNQKESPR